MKCNFNGNCSKCLNSSLLLLKMLKEKSELLIFHSLATALVARDIAVNLGFCENSINQVYIGAMMHDTGKLYMPDSILFSRRRLSAQQLRIVHKHPVQGADILSDFVSDPILNVVLSHHEDPTGKGYPHRLLLDAIPIQARIVAVADKFCALQVDRGYRGPCSQSSAQILLKDFVQNSFDGRSGAVIEILENIDMGTLLQLSSWQCKDIKSLSYTMVRCI